METFQAASSLPEALLLIASKVPSNSSTSYWASGSIPVSSKILSFSAAAGRRKAMAQPASAPKNCQAAQQSSPAVVSSTRG